VSWKIEKIFTDTGSELSTATLNTTLGTTNQAVYDGRFMWVTCANGIAIYEFWGQSSGDEPTVDEVDDLLWQRYTEEGPLRKLKLITFISVGASQIKRSTRYLSLSVAPGWTGGAGSTTVGGTAVTFTANRSDLLVATEVSTNSVGVALAPYWIAKVGDKMVVSNGANYSRCWIFDIATQRPESSFTFTGTEFDGSTITANSNLCGSNGKIWFVNSVFNDLNGQRLYNYTLGTSTLAYTTIAVRPSLYRTWVADGFNGQIYITNYNGVSITKYDYATGAQTSRIRTNAFPTKIFTDQNRQIFVPSYGGMLTLVDWDDDGVHNDYSAEYTETGTVVGFASDPTDTDKVWFTQATDGKLSRYSLSTKQQYETGAGADWNIEQTGFGTPDMIVAIPSRTYTTSTGATRTVRPYMFICDNSTVRLFAMDLNAFLVRDNYFEVNGQGAVVGGALTYFDEGP
jgi:hypothetical protein